MKKNLPTMEESIKQSMSTNVKYFQYNSDSPLSEMIDQGYLVNGDIIILSDVPKQLNKSAANNESIDYVTELYVVADNKLILIRTTDEDGNEIMED